MNITEYINSYDNLKEKLLEAARITYFERDEASEYIVSIEMALGGKELTAGATNPSRMPQQTNPMLFARGTYRTKAIHHRRGSFFQAKIRYNHLTNTIEIKNPQFSGSNWYKLREEYLYETGKNFKKPPIIPRNMQHLRGNIEAILKLPPDMTPTAYIEPPQCTYNENNPTNQPQSQYAETLELPFEEKDTRTFLEDKFRKEQP
jgi:hypothetical protein